MYVIYLTGAPEFLLITVIFSSCISHEVITSLDGETILSSWRDQLDAVLNQTLREICNSSPAVVEVLKNLGVSELENVQLTESLGTVLKLSTFLRYKKIDREVFQRAYETMLSDNLLSSGEDQDNLLSSRPSLLALMPCGLKAGIDGALETFFEQSENEGKPFTYRAEANVNHELSFYSYIDLIRSQEELPDILLTADFNSFMHREFIERFVDTGVYGNVSFSMNRVLENIGYADPRNNFTMFSANVLVLVTVKDQNNTVPEINSWKDLLQKDCYKKLIIRGQDSFFCSAVLLPFFKLFGLDGVMQLAESVTDGLHPSQMVKMIDSGRTDIASLYIMPLFFAKKIKRTDRVRIVFPEEGAFLSPVTLLIKKNPLQDTQRITEFLLGEKLQQLCADNHFLPVHYNIRSPVADSKALFWLGWDFIYNNDLNLIKNRISTAFTGQFLKGRVE